MKARIYHANFQEKVIPTQKIGEKNEFIHEGTIADKHPTKLSEVFISDTWLFNLINTLALKILIAQSSEAVEYTDCFSAEG